MKDTAAILQQSALPSADPGPERVNILVVDDLQEKLVVYRTILEELGQNIVYASSGEEALKQVLNTEFAVILLDVNMPGMDGIETASLIRKRRKSAHTPIIFVTAFSDDVHLEQGYASGAVDYLLTPVMPEILKAKVRVFIELSQMRTQAAKQAEETARRKEAEESARRKDAFLSMLAHELRNPLAPIQNAIQLLQRIPATPDITHLRAIIERQVMHMARLVDDLLDLSRIAHGKVLLRKETCDLAHIVGHTVHDYGSTFRDKNLQLKVELPDTPVWVDGDPTRLLQMVGNILHNAQKFTDTGGTVTVRITVNDADKAAQVSIEDTGIGIEPHALPHIFNVFYQTEQALDRSHGGLGLGLAMVKNLSELHNGTVTASSRGFYQGSTFTLSLPVTKAPANVSNVVPLFPNRSQYSRVLIIEDNHDTAETTRLLLEQEGYDVYTASTGLEGLDLAKQFLPQIILCDIGLPAMDGYEVVRNLRQDPLFHSTHIVALTGYGREEDRRQTLEAGFDLHLVKPINLHYLRQVLSGLQKKPGSTLARAKKSRFQLPEGHKNLLPLLLPCAGITMITCFSFISPFVPTVLKIPGSVAVAAVLLWLARLHYRRREENLKRENREMLHLNHAIRTPLTTIGGVAEMLDSMQDSFDPRQKQLVRALSSSVNSLRLLVQDPTQATRPVCPDPEPENKAFPLAANNKST